MLFVSTSFMSALPIARSTGCVSVVSILNRILSIGIIARNEKIFNIAERILKITVRTRYFLYGGTNRRNTWKNSFISVY